MPPPDCTCRENISVARGNVILVDNGSITAEPLGTVLTKSVSERCATDPATAPVARHIEEKVIAWLAPLFAMQGGHMTPGSTMANLTALWSARECAGVAEVVTSGNAHLSIEKAAHLLGSPSPA
jgi:glutamate/tyrosine decarboxylase-like PLP-dependent enzyme